MNTDMILGIAALLLSTGLLNFIQFLINRHDRKKKCETVDPERFELLVDLQLANAQELIISKCKRYISQDYITVRDKASLHTIYESYKALGGNHYAKDAIEAVNKLPTRRSRDV